MALKVTNGLDLDQTAIQNALMHPVGSDPSTPSDGQIWYRTDTDVLRLRANGATVDLATGATIAELLDDTSPQLGGMLDVNGNAIGDGTRELVTFVEDGAAVNHVEVENEATGNGPIIRSTGDDVDVDLNFDTKGTGDFNFTGNITVTGTVDGVDIAAEETRLANTSGTNTGDEVAATNATAGVVELATQAEVDTGTDTTRVVTPDTLEGLALSGGDLSGTLGTPVVDDDSHSHTTATITGLSGTNTGDEVAATEGTAGIAEVATQVETDAGTDDGRMVTPAKLDALDVTGMSWFIDEDSMATDSATRVPSQQSVKAYVDTSTTSAMTHKGGYNASTDTPALDTGSPSITIGDTYTVTAAGAFFTENVEIGDRLIADVTSADAASLADWTIVQTNIEAASTTVAGFVELATNTEVNTGTDATRAITPDALANSDLQSKVDGIEALADVTDEANVTSALNGATPGAVTVAGGDKVLIQDITDSDNLKTVTAQAIADLGAGSVTKYAVDCAATATTTVTHNLGTLDITVQVWDSTGGGTDGELVLTDVDKTSTNACDVTFATAPGAGDYRIVVIG